MTRKKKRKQKSKGFKHTKLIIFSAIGVASLLLFWYGGTHGWFTAGATQLPTPDQGNSNYALYSTCDQLCDYYDYDNGRVNSDDCNSGEANAWYTFGDRTDLDCCCYNDDSGIDDDEDEELTDDFHYVPECAAGCGIRGYDNGDCTILAPVGGAVQIGICSGVGNNPCWCWDDEYTCEDSDGPNNFAESGYCQDSFHGLGYIDFCEGDQVIDYYCDEDNICQKAYDPCPSNEPERTESFCEGGKCFDNPGSLCYYACQGANYGTGKWMFDWRIDNECTYESRQDTCSYVGGVDEWEIMYSEGASCCCWCCNNNVLCT